MMISYENTSRIFLIKFILNLEVLLQSLNDFV